MFSYHLIKRMIVTTGRYPDMVVGVSAGAIIGALLVTGLLTTVPEHDIEQAIRAVFETRSVQSPLFHTVYSGRTKTQILHTIFGDRRLGSLARPFAVVVDCIGGPPEVIRSWDIMYQDLLLADVVDASSAVPLLFPPVVLGTTSYMDGATAVRSPVCIGYLLGIERYGSSEHFHVLSVGTSLPVVTRPVHVPQGVLQLLVVGLPLCLLSHGAMLMNTMIMTLLGPRFFRIECPPIGGTVDDVSVLDICRVWSETVWTAQETSVRAFLALPHPSGAPEISSG